jgi:hypothetical protein
MQNLPGLATEAERQREIGNAGQRAFDSRRSLPAAALGSGGMPILALQLRTGRMERVGSAVGYVLEVLPISHFFVRAWHRAPTGLVSNAILKVPRR